MLTDKPNSTSHRDVNANIFFKVLITVAIKVILIPFFFILVCGVGNGIEVRHVLRQAVDGWLR